MKLFKVIAIFFILALGCNSFGQHQNYLSINLHSQILNGSPSSIDMRVLVLSFGSDTVWLESHDGVTIESNETFFIPMGKGIQLNGSATDFSQIDWRQVEKVLIIRQDLTPTILSELSLQSVPYAFHSISLETIPLLIELVDVGGTANITQLIKYDGNDYYFENDQLYDSSLFAFSSLNTIYSDTATVGIATAGYVDTAGFSFLSDSVGFSISLFEVMNSDSSDFSDTTLYAYYTKNAWQIDGNTQVPSFVGTTTNHDFLMSTNSINRLKFGQSEVINSSTTGIGFNFNTPYSVVHQMNSSNLSFNPMIPAHLLFYGAKGAFSGGETNLNLDTLLGEYSFSWGKNVGSNGPNSAVFGRNTSGDSAYYIPTGVTWPAVSSFSAGTDCNVVHHAVAIGKNAKAIYFRAIAIGNDVLCDGQASIGIGSNLWISGASTFGFGKNVTIPGHYSTALGFNVNNNTKNGCFLYGDFSTSDTVKNTSPNQFMVRAEGGTIFYTSSDLSMGVSLASGGGSWNMVSDVNKKYDIQSISELMSASWFKDLKVYQWNYKNQETMHVGPMAQDFYEIFRVGESNKYINQLDADGIIIYGLKQLSNELEEELSHDQHIIRLEEEIKREQIENEKFDNKIKELYEKLDR